MRRELNKHCRLYKTLRKMSLFHLIAWYGNFVERHSFRIVSGDSPETVWKLCLSAKYLYQEIRWNNGILRSERFSEELKNFENIRAAFHSLQLCSVLRIFGVLNSNFWYTQKKNLITQTALNYLKSTIETLEQGVKYVHFGVFIATLNIF